jgi:hypothetical protein
MMMLSLVIFMAVIVVLGLVAGAAGADTRDGNDWSLHPHV